MAVIDLQEPVRDFKGTAEDPCPYPCPLERGMRIIGGKWTGSILWHLQDGPVRFNELSRILEGSSNKMLAQRLKELEERRMVSRTVMSTKPFAVNYRLTELGETALHFLEQIKDWSMENNL